jgi:hypothetical protein
MGKNPKEKRELEQWEIDLKMEQRFLMSVGEVWHICTQVTDANIEEMGGYVDDNLLECIRQLNASMKSLLYYGADLNVSKRRKIQVESIYQALKEVNDEIKATQAGKPTAKKGNGGPLPPPPPRSVSENPDR